MTNHPQPDTDLLSSVAAFIDRERLLPPGPVVVAFSGGPDSLCLLHLLADLAPGRGWRLIAAHLDHGLRPESAAEVEQVAALAAGRDVPVRSRRVDVAALAAQHGWSIEEAGRIARYAFLAHVARDEGGAPVATGHTQDDQAETLLLHLARGAGLAGLAAMRPRSRLSPRAWRGNHEAAPLCVVRPLLRTSRVAIEAALAARGLRPLRDPTNADPAFHRSRLRHHLLPAWQRIQPGIAAHLARTAEIVAADEDYLQAETERVWQTLRPRAEPGRPVSFDRPAFLAQPLALRRRLLRHAVALRGGPTPTLAALDAALAVAAARGSGEAHLAGSLRLVAEHDRLTVGAGAASNGAAPALPFGAAARVPLQPRGSTRLPGDRWEIVCRLVAPAACGEPLGGRHAHFVPRLAEAQPVVRAWRPGDRIALPGLPGRKKLSDFFTDRKVPRASRGHVPVVAAGDTIAWIVGHAVGEPFRAHGGEQQVVCCVARPVLDEFDQPAQGAG